MMDAKKFADLLRCEASGALDVGHEKIAMAFSAIAMAAEQAAEPGWEGHTFTVPTPIPADVRDVVREALEMAVKYMGLRVAVGASPPLAACEAALAALDAAPTEKVVGYGVLTDGLGLSFRTTRAEADTTAAIMRGAGRGKFRIVRLVAEDE